MASRGDASAKTPPTPRALGAVRVLVFNLPGHLCALPLGSLQEVIPLAALARPPATPPLLEGFLNLGGWAVPVVRLDRLLGLPELTPGLHTPLLLLRTPTGPLALLVEGVRGLASAGEVSPVQEGHSFNQCVEGEVQIGTESVFLLAPERLFLEKERRRLADLQTAEQDRLRLLEEPGP